MISESNSTSTIWFNKETGSVLTIDQRLLPHQEIIVSLKSCDEIVAAIKDMLVRGAPLIGVSAAYGLYFATLEANDEDIHQKLENAYTRLLASRPTAVNLKWALDSMMEALAGKNKLNEIRSTAFEKAEQIRLDDIAMCKAIGEHGLQLLEKIAAKKGEVNILTHCNAGRLACVQWGTATSPIYLAHQKGIKVHVWVDETRPRNQGANLTMYELQQAGIPCTLISDNTGGLLMMKGMVDLAIVGADRVASNGDVANKIGTYLKALSAADNRVPFYVAFPASTFDPNTASGAEIEIEERSEDEVHFINGDAGGKMVSVRISPKEARALNYGFDITPSRLVTGYITDKGTFLDRELLKSLI